MGMLRGIARIVPIAGPKRMLIYAFIIYWRVVDGVSVAHTYSFILVFGTQTSLLHIVGMKFHSSNSINIDDTQILLPSIGY